VGFELRDRNEDLGLGLILGFICHSRLPSSYETYDDETETETETETSVCTVNTAELLVPIALLEIHLASGGRRA